MLLLMSLNMHLVLFWLIGGSFSKVKYNKYTFYKIQNYGLKIQEIQKSGCTRTALTSGAIWGKLPPTVSKRMSPLGLAH